MTVTITPVELWKLRAVLAETNTVIEQAKRRQRDMVEALAASYHFDADVSKFSWNELTCELTVEP